MKESRIGDTGINIKEPLLPNDQNTGKNAMEAAAVSPNEEEKELVPHAMQKWLDKQMQRMKPAEQPWGGPEHLKCHFENC